MSERRCSDWLETYLQYTSNSEAPYKYRLWCGISVIAAALERKCWFEWDRRHYPNMYVVLVGHSGIRKGTAVYPAERLLRKVRVHLASETTTREGLIRELRKSYSTEHVPKVNPHCSLTIFSEELTVFLGYNNVQLMMDLTQWFDCKDEWTYNTKDETLRDEIKGVWVNLLGATTPRMIRLSMPTDAIGGGLTSRMIFVFEDRPAAPVIFPFKTQEQAGLEMMLEDDLASMHSEIMGQFLFTEEMLTEYALWREGLKPKFLGTQFEAYDTRRPIHHLKLSAILSASRGNDKTITKADFLRAQEIFSMTERKMAQTFAGVGESPDAAVIKRLTEVLYQKGEIPFSELLDLFQYDVGSGQRLHQLIHTMRAMKKVNVLGIEDDKSDFIVQYVYNNQEEESNNGV